MYGKGTFYREQGTVRAGALKSSHTGAGVGLSLARKFGNGWYGEVLTRYNAYDSKMEMIADPTLASSYSGSWDDELFSLGLEVGRSFDSRDRRFSFNPYNRLQYHSTPGNRYSLDYADSSTLVYSHSVDAWTNQLGGKLHWNSLDRRGRKLGSVYIGGDYYQGLSGRFAMDVIDSAVYQSHPNAEWTRVQSSRKRNDLSYGVGTLGVSVLPTRHLQLSSHVDMLFGDVSGWSLTLGGRLRF